MVYIVRQLKAPEFKVTDELKILLGFSSRSEAERAYLAHKLGIKVSLRDLHRWHL